MMASLLLVPAAVAYAEEPITGGEQGTGYTFASATEQERIIARFVDIHENLSKGDIELQRIRFEGLPQAEKELLGTATVDLIGAKIAYLEEFIQFKTRAANLSTLIGKLSLTSGTLIVDTEQAETEREQLMLDIVNSGNTLEGFASKDQANASILVENLTYYGGNGPSDFITNKVGSSNLDTLNSRLAVIEAPQEFNTDYITPIITNTSANPLSVDEFISTVELARATYTALPDAVKSIAKLQKMSNGIKAEDVLKNAEADIAKADVVIALISEINKTKFTSATTFKSKMTSVKTAYGKLTEFQKKLVTTFDTLEDYNVVIDLIDEIDKLKVDADNFRTNVDLYYVQHGKIEPSYLQDYVTNFPKLIEMKAAIAKAIVVEGLIDEIKNENADTTVPTASTAYKALTSTEKKYVLADKYAILQEWEKSSTSAAAVIKQINAIDVSKTDFVSKVKTAVAGEVKLISKTDPTQLTKEQLLVTNRDRLKALEPFANDANEVNTLKITDAGYGTTLTTLKTTVTNWVIPAVVGALTQADIDGLTKLKANILEKLDSAVTEEVSASGLVTRLNALNKPDGAVDLAELATIRLDYNKLSSNGKKLVTNIKILADLEKQYKAALAVVTQIKKLNFEDKNYAKQLLAADAAYNKLSSQTFKDAVTNYSTGVTANKPAAQLMIDIDALKPTMKEFRTAVTNARTSYDEVVGSTTIAGELVARIVKEYKSKLESAELFITNADLVVTSINNLRSIKGQSFMDALAATSAQYKALDSSTKKNVTNASTLTAFEKDYKASLKVFNLIKDLPATTDKSYSKKVEAAEKAYGKLTNEQKDYVHNYETALKPNLKVAKLIAQIATLKISSKTYEVDVKNIRAAYEALTEQERPLVHNYSNLQSAEGNMSTAQGVISLIEAATPNAEDYIAKLLAARNAYDSLSKDQQKLVLNIKELTMREKTVKPILSLDQSILALDPSNAKTFISKYAAADKAYEKLSFGDRGLLTQESQLKTVLQPLYNVMSQIASIKSSSKTFVSDVQAARAAYTALTPEQQVKISNVPLLETHERDVLGGAAVDSLIRALSSNEPTVYVQKVKEARVAYNGLNSTNKKGVTLLDTLKEEEKYIKPVETTIDLIEGLSNPRNNLSKQFDKVNASLKKLSQDQLRLVTNYDKYSDLSSVVNVYQLIEKLKPSDKYYLGNLEAAKNAYARLTEADKLRVTNQYKLQEAEGAVDEIQKVITIIASLSSNSPTYIADIEAALAAYKALPGASKKQVLNYSQLQAAEKNVKAAQKVIKQISDLDPSLRTFESKTKSAKKAYEKLTPDQQKIVSNYSILRQYQFELGL